MRAAELMRLGLRVSGRELRYRLRESVEVEGLGWAEIGFCLGWGLGGDAKVAKECGVGLLFSEFASGARKVIRLEKFIASVVECHFRQRGVEVNFLDFFDQGIWGFLFC